MNICHHVIVLTTSYELGRGLLVTMKGSDHGNNDDDNTDDMLMMMLMMKLMTILPRLVMRL